MVCPSLFQSQKIDRLNSKVSSLVRMSTQTYPNSGGLFCHIPLLVRMNEKPRAYGDARLFVEAPTRLAALYMKGPVLLQRVIANAAF